MFVGRTQELAYLDEMYREDGSRTIVVYGRRRVGKTALANEFLKGKEGVYFLAQKTKGQPQRLTDKFAKDYNIYPPRTDTFEEAFSFITRSVRGRFVIVIDEFPYLVEEDGSIPSQFQYIIDEILAGTGIFLILQGSSIAMMENEVLAYKSPLYGRRDGQIKLSPFKIEEIFSLFPRKTMEEIIEIYGVFGAVPAYLTLLDPQKNIYSNIAEQILVKERFLYEEAEFLLRQELREPIKYKEILRTISNGKVRLSHIGDEVGIKPNVLTKYMESLLTLGILRKVHPFGEKAFKRNTIYEFDDNYLRFYFRFIYPHIPMIEEGKQKVLLEEIRRGLPQYLGKVFEDVCRAYLTRFYTKVGPYWNKDVEIDAVAIGDTTALVECKYKEVDGDKETERLKAKRCPFTPDEYLVMAKGFLKGTGIDLKRMRSEFTGSGGDERIHH